MDWVLIAAIASLALLLVFGFVIGRLLRAADRSDEAARGVPAATTIVPTAVTPSLPRGTATSDTPIPLPRG